MSKHCQMGEFHEKVIKLGHFFVGLPKCYVYRLFIWGLKGCKITPLQNMTVVQGMPPQNKLLWYIDYFELQTLEKQ